MDFTCFYKRGRFHMTKMKFTQLIDSITNENEWINKLHIVTDDKNEL